MPTKAARRPGTPAPRVAVVPTNPAPTPPGRLVEVTGEQIHVYERGSGPPLVLVHGFPSNAFSWWPAMELLVDRRRCIAIDLVGFGWSTRRPRAPLTSEAHARRIIGVLDALGLDAVDLAGTSYGAALAQRVALIAPGRVRRLVLVASVDPSRVLYLSGHSLGNARLARRWPWLMRRVVGWGLRRAAAESGLSRERLGRGYVDPFLLPGTIAALERFIRDVRRSSPIDPAAIRVPTLVIVPSRDRVVWPTVGRSLARRIPDARLAVVAGGGHTVQLERPREVAALMRGFLDGDGDEDEDAVAARDTGTTSHAGAR